MKYFLFKKELCNINFILFIFEKRLETCRDMPSQRFLWLACPGSTQKLTRVGGSLCQGRQCSYGTSTSWTTLCYPRSAPERASPTTAIFEHVHTDKTYTFTCEPWMLKTTIIWTFFSTFSSQVDFIFLLACEFFVGYYILFHIHHILIYLTLS